MKQVLYRTYRPQTFDEIYGQDHIISILKNQIKNNSISHAYLFCGPRGTGKTSTARIFAKELNNGSELDIIELDAASHNKVEDIREIVDKLSLAPFESKYKIYILDEVHMLSQSAFNAFLKSLEEPPPHIIFILATTEPNKLPQTILSRTQRFDFGKISDEEIIKRLEEVLKRENINYDIKSVHHIAKKSDGGLRDALGLLDKVVSYGEVNEENTEKALGIFDDEIHLNLLKAIIENDSTRAIQNLSIIDEMGIDPKVFSGDFIKNIKDTILVQNKVQISNKTAISMSEYTSDKNLAYIIEEIGKTINNLRTSPNAKIEFLANIISLCNTNFENIEIYKNIPANIKNEITRQNTIISTLENKILKLEEKIQKMASYPQNFVDNSINIIDNFEKNNIENNDIPNELSTDDNQNELNISNNLQIEQDNNTFINNSLEEKIKAIMPQLKQKLKDKRKLSIYSVFEMSRPIKYQNNQITFVFENENRKMIDILKNARPEEFIDTALSEILGNKITTKYVTDLEINTGLENDNHLENEISKIFPDATLIIK